MINNIKRTRYHYIAVSYLVLLAFFTPPTYASSTDASQDILHRAMALKQQGDAQQAIALLTALLQTYNAYDRVVPEYSHIRLELTVALFNVGKLSEAIRQVTLVLQDEALPSVVRKKVEEFYKKIQRKKNDLFLSRFSGHAYSGIGYSSNANSGPDQLLIGDTDIRLSDGSAPQEDFYFSAGGKLQYTAPSKLFEPSEAIKLWQWYVNTGVDSQTYVDVNEQNIIALHAEAGTVFYGKKSALSASLSANNIVRGEDFYSRSVAFEPSYRYIANIGVFTFGGNGGYTQYTEDTSDYDGTNYGIYGRYSVPLVKDKLTLTSRVDYDRYIAECDGYSYDQYGLSANLFYRHSEEILTFLSSGYQHTSYGRDTCDALALIYGSRRKDSLGYIALGSTVSISENTSITPRIQYYKNESTHDIRSYDRTTIEVRATRSF